MCTKEQALEILSEAYARCQELYEGRVRDAYLYGSYARGDFHAESDVNLLMTVDLDAGELQSYQRALSCINGDLSLAFEITVSVKAEPHARFLQYKDVPAYCRNVGKEGIRYEPTV